MRKPIIDIPALALAGAVALGCIAALPPVAALALTAPLTLSAPSSTVVNASATYTMSALAGNKREILLGGSVTFPLNTDLSGVSVRLWETSGGATVEYTNISYSVSGSTLNITVVGMKADKDRQTWRFDVSGVRNPSQPGAYSYSGTMSGDKGNVANTAAFTLTSNASAPPAVGPVGLSSNLEGAAAAYTIPVSLGTQGRVAGNPAAGPNTLTVMFPAGYTLPASAPASSVTVNGTASGGVSIAGNAVTITMPAGETVPNNGTATIVFTSAFGLTNPVAGSYTVSVSTSAETGTRTSAAFTIASATPRITVTSAAGRPGPATLEQNQIACVDGFVLQRTQGFATVNVSSVQITDGGAQPWVNIAGVRVYRDDGDGTPEIGTGDTLLNASAAAFANGQSATTVTFDSPEQFSTNTAVTYWVVYTVASNPTDGVVATSRVTDVTDDAPLLVNNATTGSTFTLKFVVRLSFSLSPGSISFGDLEPGLSSPLRTITVLVDSTYPYVLTRTITGDSVLMGLAITGNAPGAKPAGAGSFSDDCVATIPWTTPADTSMSASVQYTVVQQ